VTAKQAVLAVHGPPWRAVRARGHLALTLLRHGETSWNNERRFLGTTDIALNEAGIRQSQAIAPIYAGQFDAVYSSPLRRAYETAREISASPTVIEDFGELRQGVLEGLQWPEALARYPEFFGAWANDPASARVPGGETLGSCCTRAHRALDEICQHHVLGDSVLVVTHQMVIAALTCHITGCDLLAWREHRVPNVGASVFSWDGLSLSLEIVGWHPAQALD
jgi:probable phosphoglycerate mutase